MHIDFTPFTVIWLVLAVVVAVMAGYRKTISVQEDETLHIGSASESMHQVQVAHKLDVIDKWGKLLTVIAAVYGLLLALAYTYQTWVRASNLGL
ncbi:MAG TPA: hypothetical protein VKT49_16150 [Bryobacteraceae bacterium]|nr:hypothetical protein [Bryobacteraceae bacterium]